MRRSYMGYLLHLDEREHFVEGPSEDDIARMEGHSVQWPSDIADTTS